MVELISTSFIRRGYVNNGSERNSIVDACMTSSKASFNVRRKPQKLFEHGFDLASLRALDLNRNITPLEVLDSLL